MNPKNMLIFGGMLIATGAAIEYFEEKRINIYKKQLGLPADTGFPGINFSLFTGLLSGVVFIMAGINYKSND